MSAVTGTGPQTAVRPDSLFVLGLLAPEVQAVVAAASRFGLADVGDQLGLLDAELAEEVGERGDGPQYGRLMRRLDGRRPDRPWVLGSTRLSATLKVWREVADGQVAAVVAQGSAADAVVQLVRGGRRTPAAALAVWERSLRMILEAVEGLPTLVVDPASAPAAEVARFLQGVTAPTPPPARVARRSRRAAPALSPAQLELDHLLVSMLGAHPAFRAPALPPESPGTEDLVAADRCFSQQREALEAALARSVAALDAATPPDPPAPRTFEQGYGPDATSDEVGYSLWLDRQLHAWPVERSAGSLGRRPAIGLVVVVRRPDPRFLERCVASVVAQEHAEWELRLAPVGPVGGSLERLADRDERVVACPAAATVSAAANAAAATLDTPFLALLDQRDELSPRALAAVADALADDPEVDLLYTDEDEIDENGRRSKPRFKPDWSPDLLLSTMYMGNLLVIRRSLFEEVGGLSAPAEGAAMYDVALRASERARRIGHVPEVAYHRRWRPPSTEERPVASRLALEAAIARRGERAVVEAGLCRGSHRVRRVIDGEPLVSVIVPFRDGAGLLGRCVDSLHETAGYDRWELVLIDNQSWEPETTALLHRLRQDPRCRIVSYPHPYNWSALNNFGARHSAGDMLLFLNSDVEGVSRGWLAAMVEHAQRPEVGAVGARLLYPDGSVQHAGVVMGLGGNVAWHAFWKCPRDRDGYLGHARMIRNYSVVTGACMLVRRDAFDAVGGLDESLAILFNDVELCLRMREAGLLVVYTPFAELLHYESKTRGFTAEAPEVELMRRRWGDVIARDPYFNPNLDQRRTDFALPR